MANIQVLKILVVFYLLSSFAVAFPTSEKPREDFSSSDEAVQKENDYIKVMDKRHDAYMANSASKSLPVTADRVIINVQDAPSDNNDMGLDWNIGPIATGVIICTVFMIVIIVISMGLWFVYEREKVAEMIKLEGIKNETSVFTLDDHFSFPLEKNGKRLF